MRFWLSALLAVAGALTLAYVWVRWPRSRWPRSGVHSPANYDPLSSLKVIVEISAVMVAGIWTYDHFLRFDEPSLRTNFRAEATLERDSALASPKCLMVVQAKVENIGKTDFSVDRVVQKIWRIPDDRLWAPSPRRFVDIEALLKREDEFPLLDSVVFTSGQALAYHYVPGASASFGFPWVLPEMPSSETIVVRFDFDIDNQPGADFYFTWGKPCAEAPEKK